MTDKQTYPPVYLAPGETTVLTSSDGHEMEFIGVDDEKLIVFVIAYAEWRHLTALAHMVSQDQRQKAAREANTAFNALPDRVKRIVTERTKGRVIV